MKSNLKIFEECVGNISTSKKAEEFVRMMLERFSRNCPIPVLIQLGRCIIDYRKTELHQEAEQN